VKFLFYDILRDRKLAKNNKDSNNTIWIPEASRFDREGWSFSRGAEPEERDRQFRWQEYLASREGLDFKAGESVFISEQATINRGNLRMGNHSYVGSEAQVGGNVVLGSFVSINAGSVVRGEVTLGDDVRIATGAQILGFNHDFDDLEKPVRQQGVTRKGIVLGDDVWVGANSVILDGVKIGSHSIIGAGAVVTKSVPDWAIVGGSPARIIGDRRNKAKKGSLNKSGEWKTFQEQVREDMPGLLKNYLDPENGSPRDIPGQAERLRPWCDYTELASMVGIDLPVLNKSELINRLKSFQDVKTGLVPGPYGEQADWQADPKQASRMNDGHSSYMVMAAGYALECLGSYLPNPVKVAADLRNEDLHDQLGRLPWQSRAWGAGAWIDHYSSARAFNVLYHGEKPEIADLFGWLLLHSDPASGMWGSPDRNNSWLQPVNGFYRLTRGSYAQWGVPLPYPERSLDTIIRHGADTRTMLPGKATACFILDIMHPMWLCLRQTSYRRKEAETLARFWLDHTIARWSAQRGLAFSTAQGSEPNLQGTEMWLSIAWLCADILGLHGLKDWEPRGVHRPEPIVSGLLSLS
jgi:acetyltransferase-like isoleucine patch superfamily enzyme